MVALLGFLILVSPAVFAVEVSQCPNNVGLGYGSLIPVSEEKIERLRRNPNPEVYRSARKAYETIIRTAPEKYGDLAFRLDESEAGMCRYKRHGGVDGGLEIFSRGGTDFLRVYLPFRGIEVFTNHEIQRLSDRGLRIDYRPTTVIFVKTGGRTYHVGWAYSLTVR